jgi:hypothetical protein
VDGADAFAVVHQVQAVVGAPLEAEALRPFGEGEGRRREVGGVGVFEAGPGTALAEAEDGPERRAVAPEPGDAPGAGEVAFGGGGLGVALAEHGEELVAEGVAVEGLTGGPGGGRVTLLVRASHC